MEIILASYFEEDNHGPGRKIGISPGKPKNLDYDCDLVYPGLSPDDDTYWDYHKEKKTDPDGAAQRFTSSYNRKLKNFVSFVQTQAADADTTVEDVVGLEDGDTLLSWEKGGNTTYREILAKYLRDLGYDVEER